MTCKTPHKEVEHQEYTENAETLYKTSAEVTPLASPLWIDFDTYDARSHANAHPVTHPHKLGYTIEIFLGVGLREASRRERVRGGED